MSDSNDLTQRLSLLLGHLEQWLPRPLTDAEWTSSIAFRWRRRQSFLGSIGFLQPLARVASIQLDDLQHVERQKTAIVDNTRQFVSGRPANNVLLTGARGTGKSSLIKACLQSFADRGLRLMEVDKDQLVDLPEILDLLAARPEKFVVFCDDLSFESGESGYKALKSALDGSLSAHADNVLVYATSNRRHLLPEMMKDNESYTHTADGEIHPGEVVEEKISLSERFGLWLSFYPPKQDEYLDMVNHWLAQLGLDAAAVEAARGDALVWALERGSRSGRVAYQFARHYAGSHLKS
ncbi:MAG: ATP-binding protein [Candidatus Protistobacter heckmanni]|nr:ATP-binding protein [Candidatus Protistobacter heckmanni]